MPMDDKLVSDVGKIAVLRANAVGDFIFTLPALEAIRAAYPDAEVVLLGQPWHREFLDARPGPIDRVEVVPAQQRIFDPLATMEDDHATRFFIERMRRERFDIVFQFHGGGRHSNRFVNSFGARVTVGSKTDDAEPLDRWIPYVTYQREVLRYLEIAALAGAAPVTLEPRLRVTRRDVEEARPFMPEDGSPIAVLHPGARDPRRRWPPEKFAAVGDALAAQGFSVVINGVASEQEVVDAVRSQMRYPSIDVTSGLSLRGLLGLLSKASLLVSNDSGPIHLADAVATPVVSVFWFGNLITAGPMALGRHLPHISWRVNCPDCGSDCFRQPCDHTASFVAEVQTEDVLQSALSLLNRQSCNKTTGRIHETVVTAPAAQA
ncbi:MAG: glycosyltransferase family 9 protein [Aureliella sp.]